MEQLKALGVKPGDSAAKLLAALKTELVEERAAWEKDQGEADTLAWAVEGLGRESETTG
jgi:hypothetical protein